MAIRCFQKTTAGHRECCSISQAPGFMSLWPIFPINSVSDQSLQLHLFCPTPEKRKRSSGWKVAKHGLYLKKTFPQRRATQIRFLAKAGWQLSRLPIQIWVGPGGFWVYIYTNLGERGTARRKDEERCSIISRTRRNLSLLSIDVSHTRSLQKQRHILARILCESFKISSSNSDEKVTFSPDKR